MSNISSNFSQPAFQTCLTSFKTVFYYNWALLFIGSFGNILSIIIMNRARMRSNITSITITTLAIADTLTLLLKCLQTHLKYVTAVHYSCYLIEYFTHVCVLSSIWIIIWMTMERAFAVYFPMKINNWPTKIILFVVFTCTIVLFLLLNIHFLIAYEAKSSAPWICNLKPSFTKNVYVRVYYYWIKSLFYSWLPIVLIITTNILIILAIFRASKSRTSFLLNSTIVLRSDSKVPLFKRNERQLTIMLLLVSLAFVVLTLPFSVNQLYIRFKGEHIQTCFEKDRNRFVILLADLNHAINFILYCISGQKFRNEVQRFGKQVMCKNSKADNASINRLNNNSKHEENNESSKLTGLTQKDSSNFKLSKLNKSSSTISEMSFKSKSSVSIHKKFSLNQLSQDNIERDNFLKVYSMGRNKKQSSESVL